MYTFVIENDNKIEKANKQTTYIMMIIKLQKAIIKCS